MKSLGKFMIILGIVILLIPIIGGIYTKYQQYQMYQAYFQNLKKINQSMEELNEAFNQPNQEGVEDENLSSEGNEQTEGDKKEGVFPISAKTPNGVNVLGLIQIPKIDIQVMLVEGVTNKALKYAAGHMPGTGLPGEKGNCSIAGHRSYTFGQYFNRLDEVEIGDDINITYGNKQYKYQVYEHFLVEPSEVSVTEPQGEETVITLITCHPVVKATHRLIVRAKLIETIEVSIE